MSAIEFTNVTKTYKNQSIALKALNISVRQNKITGFIGLNGAGKSTTINIISGLLLPDQGTVSIFGEILKRGDWTYKNNIGFMLEKPAYLEYLTGQEFLEFVSIMFEMKPPIAQARIKELFEYFELISKANELIKTYSKGMRKKISLAAAILPKPGLLVLDEPLEGMDPISANQTKKILTQYVKNGGTVFFSSHELGTVEGMCDDIIIIHEGESLFHGTVDELKNTLPAHFSPDHNCSLEELFITIIRKNVIDYKDHAISWI